MEFIIEIKFIYIKNYLFLTRRDKLEFFKLTGKFENFRISNQKVVLSEKSLLLEFNENTDIDLAKEKIDEFLEKRQILNVETRILEELILTNDQIKMIFKNHEQKNLTLKM